MNPPAASEPAAPLVQAGTPGRVRRFPVPRIAFDAGAVVGARTGVGQATAGLLEALGAAWPEMWPPPIAWINSPRHDLPAGDAWMQRGNFEVVHTRFSGKALLRGWQWLDWPPVERWLGPLDLIHSPSGVVPSARRARRVVTVHDLYFRHRLDHTDVYGGKYLAATYGKRLQRADRIFCISEFTRSELLRFYPLDPNKIEVVYWGIDFARYSPAPQADDAAILGELQILPPYLLAVATHEPRKNLKRLIEGFAASAPLLAERGLALPRLAIVGGAGWGDQNLEREARRAGVASQVRLVGYQPAEKLPALYRQALAFVFPSLYEGFGLPALEAMACGCPCVLARIGALEEVAGREGAAWFDPQDSGALTRLLTEVLDGDALREKLRRIGPPRAKRFSWGAAARTTLDAYRELLKSSQGKAN